MLVQVKRQYFPCLISAAGLMVNYKYDLKDQDDNIRLFDESGGSFKIHDRINDILEL